MQLRNAIGIDPDSKGIICSYVKSNIKKPEKKGFLATKNGLNEFVRWLGKHKNIIIAIEGQNGQSKPVEKILRKNGIIFYSFKPYDVDKFRKAVLGQNKNNHKDAESVARYAMALEAQGKMDYILLEHVEFGPRCRRLLHVPVQVKNYIQQWNIPKSGLFLTRLKCEPQRNRGFRLLSLPRILFPFLDEEIIEIPFNISQYQCLSICLYIL